MPCIGYHIKLFGYDVLQIEEEQANKQEDHENLRKEFLTTLNFLKKFQKERCTDYKKECFFAFLCRQRAVAPLRPEAILMPALHPDENTGIGQPIVLPVKFPDYAKKILSFANKVSSRDGY